MYTGLQGDICLVMTSTWSKENNFKTTVSTKGVIDLNLE